MQGHDAATAVALTKRLHPRLRRWFKKTYPTFTHAQLLCVPAILDRQSILLTSPTGSGKTLAGFLGVFDSLLRKLDAGTLRHSVQCIYVSPLRALAYDIGKNISAPIVGMGLEKELLVHSRTGDTKASERARFRRRASHILVTTPESLAVMLAQESYAMHFGECQFVIVDELHSFAGNKRGADLTLSLERLERLRAQFDPDVLPHFAASVCRQRPRRSMCWRGSWSAKGAIAGSPKRESRSARSSKSSRRSGGSRIRRPATPASGSTPSWRS